MKKEKNIDIKSLTSKQIEDELKREIYKSKYTKILKSTIYSLITIAAVAALIATLIMPVLQINGTSMNPTLNQDEIVLSLKTKNIEQGDIIAFYHGNKILVKRVIAKSGQWVNMDDKGNVYIDGKILREPYIKKKDLGDVGIEFPYQVPDGDYFVLGDYRLNSIDSRNSEIQSIDHKDLVGKIVLRVWPLNQLGKVS